MFEIRGYMLDLGEGRIPTTRGFRDLVDLLARCAFNQLHLYASAALPENERSALEAYCALQGLKLLSAPSRTATEGAFVWGERVLDDAACLARLASDTTVLIAGGEADFPFADACARVKASGHPFYVCPDTSAGCSLAGRIENLRDNLERAERAGRRAGARGFLLTDWGGRGHWQPLAASLPAILLGGSFAYEGAKAAKMDLERELDRVMGAPLGGALLRLATLYLRGGAVRVGCSEFFNILSGDCGYSRHPGLTASILTEVGTLAVGIRLQAERYAAQNDWAKEIAYMANLIDCACHRRDERRLRALRDEHGRIWRLRCREEGRVESLALLPRF